MVFALVPPNSRLPLGIPRENLGALRRRVLRARVAAGEELSKPILSF